MVLPRCISLVSAEIVRHGEEAGKISTLMHFMTRAATADAPIACIRV